MRTSVFRKHVFQKKYACIRIRILDSNFIFSAWFRFYSHQYKLHKNQAERFMALKVQSYDDNYLKQYRPVER